MINPVGMRHTGQPTHYLPVIDADDNVIPVRMTERAQRYLVGDVEPIVVSMDRVLERIGFRDWRQNLPPA